MAGLTCRQNTLAQDLTGADTADNRARHSTDFAGSGIQATGIEVRFYLYRCLTDIVGGVSEQATFDRSPGYGERSGGQASS
jgi:hypothetical protein